MSVSEDDRRQADDRGESGERQTPPRFRLDQPQAYAAAGLTAPGDGVPAAAEVAPAVSSAT